MTRSSEINTPFSIMAVIAVSLSVVIAMLDSTIANVALPVIAGEFKVPASESILIVNAYQFAVLAFLLPLSALGKTVGNKRIFEAGIVFFAMSSIGCALSNSLPMLILFRMIQGCGAAAILSVNAALIKEIYPSLLLGRGLAINVMIVSVSAAAGPSIAAAVLSVTSWNWLFTLNVPIAVASLLMSVIYLRKPTPSDVRFDVPGALLTFAVAVSFSVCMTGLTRQLPLLATISFDAFILLLIGWYHHQNGKGNQALVPLRLFSSQTLSLSLMMSALSYSTQLLAYVSLPFYFHDVLHRNVVVTGLLLTAWPLATTFTSVLAGELIKRINCNIIAMAGLAALMLGMVLLAVLPDSPHNGDIVWRIALCGAGFGLFQSPNNYLIMTTASCKDASIASGLLGSSRLLGQITGSALVAIMLNVFDKHGIKISLLLGACFSLLSLLVSYFRLLASAK